MLALRWWHFIRVPSHLVHSNMTGLQAAEKVPTSEEKDEGRKELESLRGARAHADFDYEVYEGKVEK